MTEKEVVAKIRELKIEQARNAAQIPAEFPHYHAMWKRNQSIGHHLALLEAEL